jgi:Kelch motif
VRRSRSARLALLVAVLPLCACGANRSTNTASQRGPTKTQVTSSRAAVTVTPVAPLPAPVQGPATTAAYGAVILIGGLDQADTSVADIIRAKASGARRLGALPRAQHDAAAVTLSGQAVLLGGGYPPYSDIWTVSASGNATPAGHLPAPASDVAAATIGSTVYAVGGYDGAKPLDTIVAWTGSGTGRVVARMPRPLRYAAVTAANEKLIIAGGTDGTSASRDVLSFDPASGRVTVIGTLPHPLAHATAAFLGGRVLVIGGRGATQGSQTANIRAIDPATGAVTLAGRLPIALSDAGAAPLADGILVVGGRGPTGRVSDRTYLLK